MTAVTRLTQRLLSQLPEYPYELFVDEIEEGRHVCLIDGCYREFKSYEEYLSHFLYNDSHINFIKRNLMRFEPQADLGEEIVWDPIEKQQIEWNIKNDPDYALLKYNRDVTWLLEEKIKFAVKNNRNIRAEVRGVPGAGKSYATIALATIISGHWAEKLGRETVVDLDFELANILEMIGDHGKGDSLIEDEDPRGFGGGSSTNVGAFENLGKTIRKSCINYFVVSPLKTELKSVDFIIEFFAYYPKSRVTKGVLYTRKKLALGYVYIGILDDYEEYERRKDEFIERMLLTGGFGVKNYSDERILKDFEMLLDYVKKKDPKMTKTRIYGCATVKVGGDSNYQGMIADDVYEFLKEERKKKEKEPQRKEPIRVSKQGVDYEWHHFKTEHDIGILEDLYQFSKNMDLSPFLGENISLDDLERGREAWRLYFIEEFSATDATKELNKMFSPMDRKMYFRKGDGKIKKFIRGPMGTAGELVAQKWFFPDHEHVGGNDAPDLISPDVSIVEVKVKELEEVKGPENLLKKDTYIRDYIARRVPITLVVINYTIGAVAVDFFRIHYTEGGTDDGT